MSEISAQEKRNQDRMTAIRELIPMPEADRRKYDVSNVEVGGYLKFGGKTYRVDSVSPYQEHNWAFTKRKDYVTTELALLCIETGDRAYLEWERDDEIEVFVTTKEVVFSSLLNDRGSRLIASNLNDVVENEEGYIMCEGRKYSYDDDWAAMYHRDGGTKGVRVRFYEFVFGNECLTIEEWLDGKPYDRNTESEYEAFLSSPLDPRSIEVLSLRKSQEAV